MHVIGGTFQNGDYPEEILSLTLDFGSKQETTTSWTLIESYSPSPTGGTFVCPLNIFKAS